MDYGAWVAVWAVSGISMVILSHKFVESVAASETPGVASRSEISKNIRNSPRRLVPIVVHETFRRLRALVTRHPDRQIEVLRLLTVVAIAATVVSFVGLFVSAAQR
jgi:hypothetical protein